LAEINEKLTAREKLRIIGINLLLGISIYGLVMLNKMVIRPASGFSVIAQVISGSFPNFISAYLLGLLIVNPVIIRKPKHGRLMVYVSSIIISSILILEELFSIWGASKQCDIYDMLAGIIGSVSAVLTYEYIAYRQKKIALI